MIHQLLSIETCGFVYSTKSGTNGNMLAVFGIFRLCGSVFYQARYGVVRCIHFVIHNKTTNNFLFEDHSEARTRLDNLKRSSFSFRMSSSQMHMHVINFWKTEVDLIISQWLKAFQKCNPPDFNFQLGQLYNRIFPIWCNVIFESISATINSTKKQTKTKKKQQKQKKKKKKKKKQKKQKTRQNKKTNKQTKKKKKQQQKQTKTKQK